MLNIILYGVKYWFLDNFGRKGQEYYEYVIELYKEKSGIEDVFLGEQTYRKFYDWILSCEDQDLKTYITLAELER
jgi:hypothetical protein